jgi:plasmid stabilization system protein ParE
MNVRFLSTARHELDEAHEWYEIQVAGLGGKLIEELWVAIRRIMIFPESCEEVAEGVRKCLIRRFPYMLIYSLDQTEILVLAVAHQHRKPLYWKKRLLSDNGAQP